LVEFVGFLVIKLQKAGNSAINIFGDADIVWGKNIPSFLETLFTFAKRFSK